MLTSKRRHAAERHHPIDIHVGQRVRQRRTLLGMSQERLGRAVDLTFQQVQKCERGANRIYAGRLFDLSRVLDTPISFFFDDDIDPSLLGAGDEGAGREQGGSRRSNSDPMMRRETLELVRAFNDIRDPDTRKRLKELLTTIASDQAMTI